MKIRVTFTVEVDQDAWATAYGIDRSEVRQDVITYTEGALLAHLDLNGRGGSR